MLTLAKSINRIAKHARRYSIPAQEREVIGCREVVGPGMNNKPIYFDRQDFPCPAIRFLCPQYTLAETRRALASARVYSTTRECTRLPRISSRPNYSANASARRLGERLGESVLGALPDNPYLQALREKEKGDWKSLSIDEKKCLYRASFCQTFAEMEAPTGEWKSIIGCTLGFVSIAIWIAMFIKKFVLPPLPPTMEVERQQAQLQRMIDMSVNPVEGLASNWDYEKGDWKKRSRWFWE
ncbi:uncharacterized protein LOC128989214 [Macrosteles quadrilineatus]|uniref:uncharacterized protein LOC128989214 n=1 Tax=Macrosteles quadrilineatus TaxID=74068 RepID=UPI0023E0D980|nr:uncharacterized protein LOC128989214 [Macrosteles quadrilineatus]